MSNVIRQETAVFLLFILHGAGLTCFYDILRALRRSVCHSLALLSLEDFLFWMAAGFLTFYLAFCVSDGIFRGYAAIGMALGFLLYHFTLSPFLVKILAALFGGIVSFWNMLFCRILQKLIRKICKICKKRIEITRKKVYNSKDEFHGREGKENMLHKG